MSDFQAIADRVEIEALRGEFTDAAMMRDRTRDCARALSWNLATATASRRLPVSCARPAAASAA